MHVMYLRLLWTLTLSKKTYINGDADEEAAVMYKIITDTEKWDARFGAFNKIIFNFLQKL